MNIIVNDFMNINIKIHSNVQILNCAKYLNDYNYKQCNHEQIHSVGGKVSSNKF